MQNISGFGLELQIIASMTFPAGFKMNLFADDADPFDIPALDIADTAAELNGGLYTWKKAGGIPISISAGAGTEQDANLSLIFKNNRPVRGGLNIVDVITIVGTYPDNRIVTCTGGIMKSGMPARSVASSGRYKSKVYGFVFENVQGNT